MAPKLIDSEQAARILGITAEQVNDLRERRELFGKRDGSVWKFSQDDIEQYKRDQAEESGSGSDSGELTDAPPELGDDLDSILLSEVEIGDSPDSTTSTIIGKGKSPAGSDIKLAGDESSEDVTSGSDVELKLDDSSASGLKLVAGGSEAEAKEEIEELDLGLDEPSSEKIDLEDSGLRLAGDSGLEAKEGSDLALAASSSDLSLGDDKKDTDSSGLMGGSTLDLAGSDEDMVLGGSDSDITAGGGDSGIGLSQPSDIGMSLESGVDLGAGGSGTDMLELGDEDVMSRGGDDAAELQADDEFLLTPAAEGGSEESDSGSQVIALDTDADEFAVAGFERPTTAVLEEEAVTAPAKTTTADSGPLTAASVPDVRFSMANVVALAACVLFLMLGGMMMYDLVRNMWSWAQPYPVNSSIMDSLVKTLGW